MTALNDLLLIYAKENKDIKLNIVANIPKKIRPNFKDPLSLIHPITGAVIAKLIRIKKLLIESTVALISESVSLFIKLYSVGVANPLIKYIRNKNDSP